MRALTVRQPWAGAIIHGGKTIENRTRNVRYRGPLAIHVSGRHDYATVDRYLEIAGALDQFTTYGYGAFIGVVDLVDVHPAGGLDDDPWSWCCRPWGEPPGVLLKPDGKFTGPKRHLVLANPRLLPEPIPARGRLGLWTPPAEVLEQLQAVTA